ncbi:ArsR/SmtB family transcription factor [Salibacterium qingdaonense]|uniref:Transcriptional regulator, ArsR family n=1 Tax=Salibacterium qingdaonense TaxID=266892 RepID=A0A1I4IMB8_9BACI|nr:metalloregulator ArsR/SmtB family transcription factor [Salibacterium qingdaonense]SFL55207.1 transcriptional regulator, ArsR family [Salibacterium qingdaonense]
MAYRKPIPIKELKMLRLSRELQKIDFLSSIFHHFTQPVRLRILYALTIEKELNVTETAGLIQSSAATASHHLRRMHEANILQIRKEGRENHYQIKNNNIERLVHEIIEWEQE